MIDTALDVALVVGVVLNGLAWRRLRAASREQEQRHEEERRRVRVHLSALRKLSKRQGLMVREHLNRMH